MKKNSWFLSTAAILVLAGCVIRTEHKIDAHITLDIRHVQQQAEGVLDFIEGKSDTLPGFEDAGEPTSWLRRALDAIDPFETAHAQMNTKSAKVEEIATALRKNNDAIAKLKKDGCLGETNRGYVELRDCDALADAAAKNAAQQLVADENQGRKALYNEIARLNKDDGVTVTKVEQIYAVERLKRGKAGERYQLPPAGELFNDVKGSDIGKKLGDQCKPDAWVTIP
ncbi:MAG: DUF1318 domain-containing protein [Candidatus Hydrogenedentes bacterium]|nr:DUF1318 domain-containing protein [Candidatus Hydrogenedentota bacterium]